MIEANWLIFIAALLIGIVVAYWLFAHSSKAPQRDRRPDVLDEGAAPAKRNQALIDSPPAAHIDPPAMAGTMAGIGEVIAVAAQEEVDAVAEKAQAQTPVETPASPAPTPEPEPVAVPASTSGEPDDLRKIKGLGPKMQTLLHTLGVTRYEQIAGWSDADLDDLDTKLGSFAGRPRRDNWVEQAKLLTSGDTGAYEEKFGKL
jgi:predicted flap endonuclease-1-like 5' DNA nuclease